MKKMIITALCSLMAVAVQAENKKDHGADFIKAAEKYEAQTQKFQDSGEVKKASMCKKLAAIKRNAAKLARAGEWDKMNWDQYYAIQKKLNGDCKKKACDKKKVHKK